MLRNNWDIVRVAVGLGVKTGLGDGVGLGATIGVGVVEGVGQAICGSPVGLTDSSCTMRASCAAMVAFKGAVSVPVHPTSMKPNPTRNATSEIRAFILPSPGVHILGCQKASYPTSLYTLH